MSTNLSGVHSKKKILSGVNLNTIRNIGILFVSMLLAFTIDVFLWAQRFANYMRSLLEKNLVVRVCYTCQRVCHFWGVKNDWRYLCTLNFIKVCSLPVKKNIHKSCIYLWTKTTSSNYAKLVCSCLFTYIRFTLFAYRVFKILQTNGLNWYAPFLAFPELFP